MSASILFFAIEIYKYEQKKLYAVQILFYIVHTIHFHCIHLDIAHIAYKFIQFSKVFYAFLFSFAVCSALLKIVHYMQKCCYEVRTMVDIISHEKNCLFFSSVSIFVVSHAKYSGCV